ncbi:hypothetical protein [Cellulosimicrobium cellulans]|uniref:hypothetical protein n=1 Tax=Cellulosimicrobium cellulans TaxID=1710 RepID=UPI001651E91B|nr:hypothetical protein [Cellulosimicrobium cellulans]
MSTDDPTPTPAGPPAPEPGFPAPGAPAAPSTAHPAPPAPYPAPPASGPPAGSPYGAAPGGLGAPVPPGASGGGKGFAITALVLALVALVLSWVPIVNNLAAVLAVVGVVFGVIALVGAVRKARPGKAMAISAIAVAVVAFVVVIVTQIAYTRVIDDVVDDLNDSVAELEQDTGAGDAAGDPAAADADAEAPADASAAQDLAVLDVAFGQNTYDPTTWWYVAVVDNPNAEHVFPFAGFTVEAVGADGTILDSAPDYVDLLPGQTALTGVFLSVGDAPVDHLEVRGPQASEAVHESDLGTFAVADVAAASDEWSTTVGGTLTSAFQEDQELVSVVVVATAPDGTILGAQSTYVDRLPAGGQARFEAVFLSPLPADTAYTAFPRL